MEKKKRINVRPTCSRLIIISNSRLRKDSGYSDLLHCNKDADKVRDVFIRLLNFDDKDVMVLRNKEAG
jgi:hypothetical protein